MARTAISAVALTKTGYNLTDSSDFETMSTGSGNGVEIPFNKNHIIVLKNGTGGTATFTFDVPGEDDYSDKGVTIPDATEEVADGKTHLILATAIFKQSDGDVYVDCDVAGEILVLDPAG